MTCFMWSGTQCLMAFCPSPWWLDLVYRWFITVCGLSATGGWSERVHALFPGRGDGSLPLPLDDWTLCTDDLSLCVVSLVYHCVWSLCYRRAVWTGSCTVSWPRWWQSVGHTCRHWAAMLWSHFSWLSASLKTTYTRTRWSSESYSTSLLEVTFSLAYRLLENLLRLPCAKNYYPLCRMGALSDTVICLPVCLSVCLSQPRCTTALGCRHTGCLQLSHVQTADPSADGHRSAVSQTAFGEGGISSRRCITCSSYFS